MDPVVDQSGKPPAPPNEKPGDKGEPKTRTFTEEEVEAKIEAKLRGVLKESKTKDAKLAAFESEASKRKESELTTAERAMRAEAALAEKDKLISDLTARETARLDKVSKANEKRLEALPKELRTLVPDGLGADETADQLGRLEALRGSQIIDVSSGSGRTKAPTADETVEMMIARRTKEAADKLYGKGKK